MTTAPEYLVHGSDGQNYPADRAALEAWFAKGIITAEQYVFELSTQRWRRADELITRSPVIARPLTQRSALPVRPKLNDGIRRELSNTAVFLILVMLATIGAGAWIYDRDKKQQLRTNAANWVAPSEAGMKLNRVDGDIYRALHGKTDGFVEAWLLLSDEFVLTVNPAKYDAELMKRVATTIRSAFEEHDVPLPRKLVLQDGSGSTLASGTFDELPSLPQ